MKLNYVKNLAVLLSFFSFLDGLQMQMGWAMIKIILSLWSPNGLDFSDFGFPEYE